MRRVRQDHLHRSFPMSMNGLLRCQAKLTQPKAGVAACLAMIPSAYNGTILSSHSRKQWGQLGEILGGVRFPMGAARRRFVQPPDSPGSSVE